MKPSCFAVATLLLLSLMVVQKSDGEANEQPPALTKFAFENTVPLKIVREAIPSRPFTVVGPRGALLGRQDGSFEAWIFPWKIFSKFRISAEMKDYPVPIDVNDQDLSHKRFWEGHDFGRTPNTALDCSDQPNVPFDRFDYIVHLSAPYLFGHAKSEAFDSMERNMRR